MDIAQFLDYFDRPRRGSKAWRARCPAHADRLPSLSISEGTDGRILLRCFAGCTAEEIVSAMGLSLRNLFPDERPNRDALRVAKDRREEAKKVDRSSGDLQAVYRKAEEIIQSARGIDFSTMTETELDELMDIIGDAYNTLWPETRRMYSKEI